MLHINQQKTKIKTQRISFERCQSRNKVAASFADAARGNEVREKNKKARRDEEKQAELLGAGNDQKKIDEIGDAIISLREERQAILADAAARQELQDKVNDLISFLDEQTSEITEYSETLVRRLIEKITIYDEKITVEFKSGLEIEVDA